MLLGEAGLLDVVIVSGTCINFVKTALGSEHSKQSRFREYIYFILFIFINIYGMVSIVYFLFIYTI